MSSGVFQQIIAYIGDADFLSNHWILSLNKGNDNGFHEIIRSELDHVSFTLPSLKESKEEIPQLVTLYLSNLNQQYNKQVLGIEPKGMQMIINFSWPGNLTQLNRVLEKLVINTKDSYIKARLVNEMLSDEDIIVEKKRNKLLEEMQQMSLNEINAEIIEYFMNKNNDNQTLTAKQLGISRSTLWRMLKK